jgi:tubulin-specific chaperone E
MVVLDSCRIHNTDTAEEIERTCPLIMELDLSRNLFERLEAMAGICGGLKSLRSLRLTGNRFSDVTLVDELQGAFCLVE